MGVDKGLKYSFADDVYSNIITMTGNIGMLLLAIVIRISIHTQIRAEVRFIFNTNSKVNKESTKGIKAAPVSLPKEKAGLLRSR